MIQEEQLQGLLFAYIFTLLANLIVGLIQYQKNKNYLQLNMIAIWVSTIFILVVYFLIERIGARIAGLISGPLLFFNFVLYAQFISGVRGVKFSAKASLRIFGLGYLLSIVLFFLNVPFTYFAMPVLLTAILPFFVAFKKILRVKTGPFTVPQIIFFTNQLVLALVNLTWNPERLSLDLAFFGFSVSLATGQIHAIIVPIVGNDAIFKQKTDDLENIISKRVNELSLVRKQLWETNKNATIGRMAGGLAHEFNSFLSLINIQAELLERRMSLKILDDTFVAESVFRIQQNVESLGKITSALRKIARDEGNVNKSVYDLESVVQEVLIHFQEQIEKTGVQLKINTPELPLFVKISGSDISHVIIQLLNNAFEAIEHLPEKYIIINLKFDSDTIFVEIEDSGTISNAKAERIMQPFYTAKLAGRGIGLGLSVSQSIVEAHGGSLYLDKASKNTKFIFTLPRFKKEPETEETEGSLDEQRKDIDR